MSTNSARNRHLQEDAIEANDEPFGDALMNFLAWSVGITAMIIGFLGTALPALPGTPLIFMGAFFIAWWTDYTIIGAGPLLLLAFLGGFGFVVDIIASSIGAQRVGASGKAVLGATLGSILGLFFALPGMILGPFVGAALGQYYHDRSIQTAAKVGLGTWIGLLVGTAAKVAIAFAMIATFITALAI
jgi:uncharacterized protein